MKKLADYIDLGTLSVMGITLILFLSALFTRGFTHALLLEGGVFLISVKLMLNHYRQTLALHSIEEKLNAQKELIEKIDEKLTKY